jgi:hypothetical protein
MGGTTVVKNENGLPHSQDICIYNLCCIQTAESLLQAQQFSSRIRLSVNFVSIKLSIRCNFIPIAISFSACLQSSAENRCF